MRCLFGFLCVCALVETLPLSASAQEEEVSSEPAPDEPALQLRLDSAGVEAVPSAPRTGDGYTLEEMELRVKRAKIGLWSTAGATVLGGVIIGAWWVWSIGWTASYRSSSVTRVFIIRRSWSGSVTARLRCSKGSAVRLNSS